MKKLQPIFDTFVPPCINKRDFSSRHCLHFKISFAKVILKSITNLLKIVTTIVTRDIHKVIKKNTHQSR
jgi:hypothetical protein